MSTLIGQSGYTLLEDFSEDQEYLYSRVYVGADGVQHHYKLISHYFTELSVPDFMSVSKKTVHIDNQMVPIISDLWDEEIETQFCCSGSRRFYYNQLDEPTEGYDIRRLKKIVDQGMILFPNNERYKDIVKILRNHDVQIITVEHNLGDSRLHLTFDRIAPINSEK